MGLLVSTRRAAMGAPTYVDKVLSYAPIAYWPLDEAAGAVAACKVNPAQNGTAVGVTWNNAVGPDGVNGAPFFDGANDYVNIYTATLNAAFNGATGSMMLWFRVFNVGVWTDATVRRPMIIQADANNNYYFEKTNIATRWRSVGTAGAGPAASLSFDTASPIDWVCAVMTWSDGANADEFRAYLDGVQYAAPSAALNVWAGGNLSVTQTVIGAVITTPLQVWNGWLAHAAVWDRVLTQPEITALANPAP